MSKITLNLSMLVTRQQRETQEYLATCQKVRQERDSLITQVEWVRQRHLDEVALGVTTTLRDTEYIQLLSYIQDLRSVPNQQGFPHEVGWPEIPDFIEGVTNE